MRKPAHLAFGFGIKSRLLLPALLAVMIASVASAEDESTETQKGNEASKKGDYENSLAYFNRAIQLNPKSAEAYCGRGYDYSALAVKNHDLSLLQRAIADDTTSIELNPISARTYTNRAVDYVRTGQYDEAIKDLNHALSFGVTLPCYRDLGIAYAMKQDHEHAIQSFTQAIIMDPKDGISYYRRGCEQAAQSNAAAAVADFDQAILVGPKMDIFYSSRGLAYEAEDEDDRAMADSNQALQLDPKNAQVYLLRGSAFGKTKNYSAALADFKQAIVFDPKSGLGHTRLGFIYGKMGNLRGYEEESRLACQLDPRDPECTNNLAWYLATAPESGISEGKEAVKYATGACEAAQWDNAALIDTLAAAYARAGDFDAAIRWETKMMTYTGLSADVVAGAKKRLALYQAHHPCLDMN